MKYEVIIPHAVEIEVNESKFTSIFLKTYSENINPEIITIEDHVKNLSSLYARGLVDSDIVEGYGSIKEMGIIFDDSSILPLIIRKSV